MEREELEKMGVWERQVACSKLWEQLTTQVYGLKDNRGRTPPQARLRKTDWPGHWLYMDDEGFQLLEDQDVRAWTLVEGG